MTVKLSVLLLVFLAVAALPRQASAATLDLESGVPLAYPGPIGVVNLYWNANWNTSEMDAVDAKTRAVIASAYAVKARQYGVPGFTWAGRGRVLGICPSAPPPSVRYVTVVDIAAFLSCEESFGGVPPAQGRTLSFGSASTIYNVIVPADRRVQLPGGALSCDGGFGGFHFAMPSGPRLSFPPLPFGRPILFTVIAAACAGRDFQPVISHELIEAATDPLPPLFWIDRSSPVSSWLSKGEAGDVCSALYAQGTPEGLAQESFKTVAYAGTEVGAFWSNADHACVVGPSRVVYTTFQPLGPIAPSGLLVGGVAKPVSFTGALLDGTPYQFTFPDPGPDRQYRYSGTCAGAVVFPAGNVNAAASQTYSCGATAQDVVRFDATGLAGRPWHVSFDGFMHAGPTSTIVDEGSSLSFAFEAFSDCTLTGTSAASPLTVTQPVTVTATYDCPPPPPPPPTGFVVNSTRDAVDASPGDGVCATAEGDCTLRAAVMEANALRGPDTIILPAGTYALSIPAIPEPFDTAAEGDLDVQENLTLVGAGPSQTIIDGAGISRIFENNDTLRISGVTLRGGRVFGLDFYNGGGAIANYVDLFLSNAVVEGNYATFGGGIENESNATLTDVIIRNNTVPFTGFSFADLGGGIYNGSELTLRRVTIEGNSAPSGAGLANQADAWIFESTLSGNVATDRGGGVYNDSNLTVENSTITGNSAGTAGGAIFDQRGVVSVTASTLASNSASAGGGLMLNGGKVTLATTIAWGNTLGDCAFNGGTIFVTAPNLVGDLSCGLGGLEGVDPLLGALQQNGGATETRALGPGSPAIDAGGDVCPATDQRGVVRPQGRHCDIGAFERP